jgi:general secretion pathway protein A
MSTTQPWHLHERPFETVWDTRFFFGSSTHSEALHRLHYHASERGMSACLLTGDIGSGKSMTRAMFGQVLDKSQYVVVSLDNTGFEFDDLLTGLLRRLEPHNPNPPASRYARCERLAEIAGALDDHGRHLVVVLDEAQDMPAQALHELRMITNFNNRGRGILSLILIGQADLRQRVEADHALSQRVSLRYHLRSLLPDEAPLYLSHRLRIAGHPTGDIFTPQAAQLIYHASSGVPRQINRFAKLAMDHAWTLSAPFVDHSHVQVVVRDYVRHLHVAPQLSTLVSAA